MEAREAPAREGIASVAHSLSMASDIRGIELKLFLLQLCRVCWKGTSWKKVKYRLIPSYSDAGGDALSGGLKTR